MIKTHACWATVLAVSIGMIGTAHAEDAAKVTTAPVANLGQNSVLPQSTFDVSKLSEQVDPDGAIKVGSFYLYPTVDIGYGYNDNVNGAESNPTSSSLYTVRPAAYLEYAYEGDEYKLGYSGAFTRYSSSSSDDTNTHEFQAQASNVYTERARSVIKAGALWSADARGSTDRTQSTEPDRYRQYSINGLFAYGAKEATGRLEGEVGFRNKRYLNNLASTAGSDLDSIDVAGRFFYRLAPKTRSFVELRNTSLDYKLATSTQDGAERRAMLGLDWEATAATSGVFKLGVLNKVFDSATRKDFTGLSWEGDIIWTPLEYSSFELQTFRKTSDSTGSGDYLVESSIGLTWNYQWNSRVSSKVGYSYNLATYHGIDRKDDIDSYGGSVTYKFRRWLDLSLDYRHVARNSNVSGQDYSKNIYMFLASFGL